MSAARAGVSAVAISRDPNNVLVKDFMAMAFPPLSQPARNHPASRDWRRFRSVPITTSSSAVYSPSQAEYVQHGGRRLVLQLGRVLDDERPHTRSHQNRNVLLAVDRIADRRSLN